MSAITIHRLGTSQSWQRLRTLLRFGMTSGLSFFLTMGLTVLLHEVLGWDERVAFAVVLAVVFLVNFTLLKLFVFRDSAGSLVRQLVSVAAASLTFRTGEYIAFLIALSVLAIPYVWAMLFVLVASFVGKFFLYGRVFRSGR